MLNRSIKLLKSNSLFLFGPRGTGKSFLLKQQFEGLRTLWIDLLDPLTEDRYARRPDELRSEILHQKKTWDWVVLDEVQKLPRLLDVVHQLIESHRIRFALTGSSARKLKRGAANLLAGRAFVYHLFPLTYREMEEKFDLNAALRWGGLPRVFLMEEEEEKKLFLKTYATTYLKEEIWAEQIVRRLDPFRKFLEIAAQANGEIVNYSNIAKDVGVDNKTVQSYFQILEDTLVGFFLEPYHRSIRKQQRQSPKFFFFDTGVKRALEGTLNQELVPNTYGYGKTFEHYLLLEMKRLNDYGQKDFRFSYLLTKDGAEIDLILERPGLPAALVEIKSTDHTDERDTQALEHFLPDFKKAEAFCLSRDPIPKKIGKVSMLPWGEGLRELGF
ncbi:MAG: AAA family ATPase [bacterium]